MLLCAAAVAVWAQQQEGPAIFRSDTHLVVCHTTVVDKNGHLVTNLPREAFTVYENGQVQEIKNFRREDIPVSLGLIIDNSGSMRDKRAKVEAAALALVKDSNSDDEVFVVNFNDEAFLDNPHGKDFAGNLKELEEACRRLSLDPKPQAATFPRSARTGSGYVSVRKEGTKQKLLVKIARPLSVVRGEEQKTRKV